ncbi:hypothetical protein GCM10020220_032500 [Nonomuraea rubra]|uniref:hypothetical protein n=1 Tax=Nonomuraea rubra TaxID=46180 RepID=UPI0031EA6D27
MESSQRSATSDAFADRLQIADALTPETDDPTKPVSDAEQGAGNLLDDVMNTVTGSGENGSEKALRGAGAQPEHPRTVAGVRKRRARGRAAQAQARPAAQRPRVQVGGSDRVHPDHQVPR